MTRIRASPPLSALPSPLSGASGGAFYPPRCLRWTGCERCRAGENVPAAAVVLLSAAGVGRTHVLGRHCWLVDGGQEMGSGEWWECDVESGCVEEGEGGGRWRPCFGAQQPTLTPAQSSGHPAHPACTQLPGNARRQAHSPAGHGSKTFELPWLRRRDGPFSTWSSPPTTTMLCTMFTQVYRRNHADCHQPNTHSRTLIYMV
jgi:hypothetical protein